MPQRIDYIIYMEHRVREFDAAVLLHSYLKGVGLKGAIAPTHYNIRLNVLKYKPDIVIVPQCYSEKNDIFKLYESLYGKSFLRMNLHQEQITDKSGTEFMMPSDEYSKDMYHICWGEKFAKQLIEYGVDSKKIFVTGSTRADLIINRNNDGFRNEVSQEFGIDKNKKWLLVPMNFSLVFVDDEYLNGIEESGGKNIRQRVQMTKESMDAFFDVLNECVNDLKDYEIILRPHPYEDPDNYNDLLQRINRFNNVYLIRMHPVGNWIHESFRVVNWTSTSALEAVMAKIPVANLQPLELSEDFKMEYFKYLPLLKTKDDLLDFIKGDLSENKGIDEFIKETFYRLDGMSTNRICAVIKNALSCSSIAFTCRTSIFVYIRYLLFSALKDMPKLMLLKLNLLDKIFKKYKGLKEDYVSESEVGKIILEKKFDLAVF